MKSGSRANVASSFTVVKGAMIGETYAVFSAWDLHENHVLRSLPLHEGRIGSAPVYPRLVVEAALRHHAAKVVRAHNHPGGLAQPSDEDIAITHTLVAVFDALVIPVVDHFVVAGPRTFSMAEAGFLRATSSGTTAPLAVGGAT